MKKPLDVTYKKIGKSVHIFINGVVHLGFKEPEFKGFQAWKMGRENGLTCMELYFVSDGVKWSILLEYDEIELSKKINEVLTKFI